MKKAEFIDYIAEQMDISKNDAGKFLDIFITGIHEHICSEEVRIPGLGIFTRTKRKARIGRNPQTGAEIQIAAKWAPVFKASSQLKEVVQKKK